MLLRARDWQDRPQFGRLCDWWRKGTAGVCALVGIGGAGKTAIAERFLRILPGGLAEPDGIPKDETLPPPGGAFVFSFYEVPNPDTFFAQLSAWLAGTSFDESAKVPSYQQTRQDLTRVASTAEKQGEQILLVLDGLEKVQDDGARGGVFGQLLDGRLSDLVLRLAGGYLPGVRAVITTRFAIAELDQAFHAGQAPHYLPIPVEEISEETGIALLRKLKVRGTDEDRRRIVRECGRHAMTVDLAGGYLAEFCDGNPDAPLELGTAEELEDAIAREQDPRRRAVLKQEHRFARIALRYREGLAGRDPAALSLMERVCLFRLGVDAATLASIFTGSGTQRISGWHLCRLKQPQVEQKLQMLARMRLLEPTKRPAVKSARSRPSGQADTKPAIVYSVHPAVRDGFLAGLDESTAQRGHEAARKGLEGALADRPGEEYPSDPAILDLLEEIIHHTLKAGHVKEAWEIHKHRIGGYRNLVWRLGAYERGERICRALADDQSPQSVLSTLRSEGKPTREADYPFESLSDDEQAIFIIEWGVYLSPLGRLDAAADCYQQSNHMAIRRENWGNGSLANQNLAHVWLLAGRLTAGLKAAEEALRLAELADEARERRGSHSCRAHAHALRGETDGALADFDQALHWQHEDEGETDGPLYSLRGIRQALLLGRLGRHEEATRLTERNKELLAEVIGTSFSIPKCNLVLADLAREGCELTEALKLQEQAHEWAIARDAKQLLCWSAVVRARIQIAQAQSKKSKVKKEELLPEAAKTLAEGLHIAGECGYGIFHIDLLAESARLHLLRGDPAAALADLHIALDEGRHPPAESGYPELLAATDEQCGYAWGIVAGRHLRAEALLLQAAQTLGRPDFVPAKFDKLPAKVRDLIEKARKELKQSQKLRKKIKDAKITDTEELQERLDGGVLTEYPLKRPRAKAGIKVKRATPKRTVMSDEGKRFSVALSFPGEHRPFVGKVAKSVAKELGQERVFYDKFYEAELARPDLDTYLQGIYHDESDLIVMFLCADYERKEWCGLEWRAIRDLLKKKHASAIMPFRFDDTHIAGLFSIDGYISVTDRSPEDVAELILQRVQLKDEQGHPK